MLAGCAIAPERAVTASTAEAPEALAAVNAYRGGLGLAALRLDARLGEAALRQAIALARADTLSHEIAGGLRERLIAVGIRDVAAAENLGRGTPDAGRAVLSWRHSPPHDHNLRLVDVTRAGFARADAAGGPWWVLVLAGDEQPGYRWSAL